MGSWAVVATVRAPQHHVERFVRHYLDAGARRIYLFFDDPELVANIKNNAVKISVCDAGYWNNDRPRSIEDRQRKNSRRALRWSDSEWLLHCDIDELAYYPNKIDKVLETVPEDVASVLVPPFEAVYDREPSQRNAFDTRFFKQIMKVDRGYHPIVWECYSGLARLTTGGFWGHIRGKSFIRKSLAPAGVPIHKYDNPPEGTTINYQVHGLMLLHFDSLTFVDWKEKTLRRLDGAVAATEMGHRREQQLEVVRRARAKWGEWGLHDLYRRMTVFDEELMARAIAEGFVIEVER